MIYHRLLAAFAAIALAVPASAATTIKTFNFVGTNIQNTFGTIPSPVSSVILSVTVTFDPLLSYNNEQSGITLNSSNLALGSTLAFRYAPGEQQRMSIGGLANGVLGVGAPNNDFTLDFRNAAGAAPLPEVFLFTNATPGNGYRAFGLALTVAPVPEPASWAMMIIGFALAGAAIRQSRSHRGRQATA